MYTRLLVKHFEQCVPIAVHMPIPSSLKHVCAAFLILHNTGYPRHFLNGYHFILHETEASSSEVSNISDADLQYHSFPDLGETIFSLIHFPDSRWHLLLRSNPFFSQHFPLTISSRVLGLPSNAAGFLSSMSKSASWTLSMKPCTVQRLHMSLRCYATQLWTNSSITNGSSYFCKKFPAKRCSAEHETTLAWVCGDIGPVGYIQYISLQDEAGKKSNVLVTGLSVEDRYRRRGFAKGLISALIRCVWPYNEIWVAVHEENIATFSLYLQCGFVKRRKQWDMTILNSFDKM